ncbi:DUF554 domain-containing protein [Ligilactobacillus equi]
MIGSGTLVNTLAVAGGGILGYLGQRLISNRIQAEVLKAMGLAVFFIGVAGCLSQMLIIKGNRLSTQGEIMLAVSLGLGTVIGELLNLDAGFNWIGRILEKRFAKPGDSNFATGFIVTSLTVCIGAMAIVGALQDGLNHDPSLLYTKSLIDFIIVLLMATVYGLGCSFAALPILIFEGGITLLAVLIQGFINESATQAISLVGSTLITVIGINMLWEEKIKVANMLPALVVAAIYVQFFN